MTDLEREVKRRTRGVCNTIRRRWVVYFMPGDTFGCREEGRRKMYLAPISKVCVQVAKWNVQAEQEAKKKRHINNLINQDRGYRWRRA